MIDFCSWMSFVLNNFCILISFVVDKICFDRFCKITFVSFVLHFPMINENSKYVYLFRYYIFHYCTILKFISVDTMRYAQIVMGPAGSGKSTYCSTLAAHGQVRVIFILKAPIRVLVALLYHIHQRRQQVRLLLTSTHALCILTH